MKRSEIYGTYDITYFLMKDTLRKMILSFCRQPTYTLFLVFVTFGSGAGTNIGSLTTQPSSPQILVVFVSVSTLII